MNIRVVAMTCTKRETRCKEGTIVAFCDVEAPAVRYRGAALVALKDGSGWAILPPKLRDGHPLASVVGVDWLSDFIPAATVAQAVELYARLGGDVGLESAR
jgi:hypothetical protein